MANLLPADTYIVINKTNLIDSDRMILSSLYQPIIGSVAISLYFTLWSYLDKREIVSTEWTHHHLMSSMRIDLENLLEARKKLEALGLITTYFKKGDVNSYVFELYSPVTPYEFFSNPILSTTLHRNIGKIEYERLISYYQIPTFNLSGFTDISETFSSVFEFASDESLVMLSEDIKKFNYRQLEIISNIDLDEVFANIPEEMISRNSITKDLKDLIYKLSFIYNLTNEILIELIKNSIDEKRTIDKSILKNNCESYFKFENNGRLPSLAYKLQPENLRNTAINLSNHTKMIYTFETTSPHDFLLSQNGSNSLTKQEREILSYLLIDLDLKPGVVNVLIDYVLKINNKKLIKSFVDTIATQWKRSNIETVKDAMILAEKEYKNRQTIKTTVKSKTVIDEVPEWIDKKIESKKLDDNRKKTIEEMMKEYK